MPTLQEWIDCIDKSGKPLPRETCEKYRARHPEMVRGELPPVVVPRKYSENCVYRGNVLRTVNTPGCSCRSDTTQVYFCELYKECTLHRVRTKPIERIHDCVSCQLAGMNSVQITEIKVRTS